MKKTLSQGKKREADNEKCRVMVTAMFHTVKERKSLCKALEIFFAVGLVVFLLILFGWCKGKLFQTMIGWIILIH